MIFLKLVPALFLSGEDHCEPLIYRNVVCGVCMSNMHVWYNRVASCRVQ